jgi:uncharacterized SAM-binding protein YcdF (DUF218 family)
VLNSYSYYFLIRYLANLLLNPLTHFWLVLILGLFFYRNGFKATSYWIIGYAVLWLFVISSSPLFTFLAKKQESLYPVLWEVPTKLLNPHIIVLGAGHTIAPSLPPNNQLSSRALARLVEGIRLKQGAPGAKLIGSGYSRSGRIPQAEMLMNTAVALGASPVDTFHSPLPYNTETEAYAYAQRFGTQTPVILVTDAIHMPRALFWFRQAGVQAIPAPTNHFIKLDPQKSPYNFKPSSVKINITATLLHEWVGMLYARWKT